MPSFVKKCVYCKCKLGCSSYSQHRAVYASISEKNSEPLYTPSKKINYDKLDKFFEEEFRQEKN